MKLGRAFVRLATRIPGLYSAVAFLAGKRVVVRGRSMLPALAPGERVLFDRLAYVRGEPTLGDIVLARHAARPGIRMIKRIADVTEDGGYLLLGDNHEQSMDSRTLGAFRREDIVGRAWMVYWPAERVRRV